MRNAAVKKSEKLEAISAIEQKMEVLKEMRAALDAGSKDLAQAIAKMDKAGLETMQLHPLLVEAAEAGSSEAIEAVVLAAGENVIQILGKPDGDLAKKIIRAVGYRFEKEKVVLDESSYPTGISKLVLECVRNETRTSGATTFLRALIAAEADTSSFINTVIRSDLDFQSKMRAVALAKKKTEIFGDALQIVEKEVVDMLTRADRFYSMDEPGRKALETAAKVYRDQYGSTDKIVETLSMVHECESLSAFVKADPGSFELASKLVLERGSPKALAAFYRDHKDRCDKKVFHARLSEALKPDPDAMANMILEGGKGFHPHMHPIMMDMMMYGPPRGFGRW